MDTGILLTVLLGALAALMLIPRFGLLAQWRQWSNLRERALFEDALKHVFDTERRGQRATTDSLAGALHLPPNRLVGLIAQMEARGVLQSHGGGLRLTSEGERWALQIVRAHRLWERYLSDEARVPMSELHGAAERAEHHLTAEKLDALDAHLGHPSHDPHGDPIPKADGSFASLEAVPLTDWPQHEPAEIVHIEDEPDVIFKQILAVGLLPGTAVRVFENRPDCVVLSDGEQEHHLAPVVAANIHVKARRQAPRMAADVLRLSDLRGGQEAEVVAIDPQYRGFGRRRLMDLGLTPHARVQAHLTNAFGDPRAYLVRGTMIALRKDQAALIWVRPKTAPVQKTGMVTA